MRPEDAAQTIERLADGAASAMLAAAVGFACFRFSGSAAAALTLGATASTATWLALRHIQPTPHTLPLSDFALAQIECDDEAGELLLAEEMPTTPAAAGNSDELLLDDVLQEIRPEARVVRLFAKPQLPTAGQLSAAIDRHLAGGASRVEAPDASDALRDALAHLRRSLR